SAIYALRNLIAISGEIALGESQKKGVLCLRTTLCILDWRIQFVVIGITGRSDVPGSCRIKSNFNHIARPGGQSFRQSI
ncbi:MAG: hypothetical protein ACLFS4_05405, partial [Opitutales bacterium]